MENRIKGNSNRSSEPNSYDGESSVSATQRKSVALKRLPSESTDTSDRLKLSLIYEQKKSLQENLHDTMKKIETLKQELKNAKEKLRKKEDKIKQLTEIKAQVNKNQVKFKLSMECRYDNFLSARSLHERTKSSSGGFNWHNEDWLKSSEEPISPGKLKEDNGDLVSKIACMRDTIEVLKTQMKERKQQLAESKHIWDERERTLRCKLQQLTEESAAMKKHSEENMQTIEKLKKDCDSIRELYDSEETKALQTNKEINSLRAKFNSSDSRSHSGAKTSMKEMFKSKRSVDGRVVSPLRIEREMGKRVFTNTSGSNTARMKTPHVRLLGKEMLSNPSDTLFL